jgi:hypothetical protein
MHLYTLSWYNMNSCPSVGLACDLSASLCHGREQTYPSIHPMEQEQTYPSIHLMEQT